MNKTTEITGRTARTATGRINNGQKVTFAVGGRVEMSVLYAADDGGELSCRAYGTIERLGVGTEFGMRGETVIAEVRWERHGIWPQGRLGVVAVRHLAPSTVAALA